MSCHAMPCYAKVCLLFNDDVSTQTNSVYDRIINEYGADEYELTGETEVLRENLA
jgi:hypothetical protein